MSRFRLDVITYKSEDDEDSLTFGDADINKIIKDNTGPEGIQRYAVYWLECHSPDFEYRDVDERQEVLNTLVRLLDVSTTPSWVSSSLRSENLHYVGFSASLSTRINNHIMGNGSEFCRLFPPYRLRGVWWFNSEKEAKLAEQSKAADIRKQVNNGFVFQF